MDWNDLRFFLAVARHGSLLGAAQALEVNHSTVFRRVNRFESSIGARLFDRMPDGYHLTQAGEELYEHALRIGDEFDQLELHILGKDFQPRGTVRITAPDNLAYEFLPAYLTDFYERYPDIHIELVVGAASLDLTRREADIAIRATTAPPPHLIGRRVCSLDWAFFAGHASRGIPRSQSQLPDHRIIGADGAMKRLPPFRRLDEIAGESIIIRCSTLNAMSAMAEAGAGIALLPDDQIKPELRRLFVLEPSFVTDIWLLTHPELRRTQRIRLLMDHLFEAFRNDERIAV